MMDEFMSGLRGAFNFEFIGFLVGLLLASMVLMAGIAGVFLCAALIFGK
jgi:uncharacterized membrane protein